MRTGHDAVGNDEAAEHEEDLYAVAAQIRELLYPGSKDAGVLDRSRMCQVANGDHDGSETAQSINVFESPRAVCAFSVERFIIHGGLHVHRAMIAHGK